RNMVLEIAELEIPFRESVNTIGRQILPLIEKITNSISSSSAKYAAVVGFKNQNPYFGFFVRNVPPANISNFQCEYFDIVAGEQQCVSVAKDGIELVSSIIMGI